VSHSEAAEGMARRTSVDDELAQPGQAEQESIPAPAADRPLTGDPAVDDALARLDQVADQPLEIQLEVGEQVYRVLQDRLADLGKE